MDHAAVRAHQVTMFSIKMVGFLAAVAIFQPLAAVVALACLAFITSLHLSVENALMGRLVNTHPAQLEAIWYYYYYYMPENGAASDGTALEAVNDPLNA